MSVNTCVDQSEVHGTDLRPNVPERWRPFPGQAISLSSVFLSPVAWHRSSLISPAPTGLFFHLHILYSQCQPTACFPIPFLLSSLAGSPPESLSVSAKCCIFISPPALCPLQLRHLTPHDVNHSAPPPLPHYLCRCTRLFFLVVQISNLHSRHK